MRYIREAIRARRRADLNQPDHRKQRSEVPEPTDEQVRAPTAQHHDGNGQRREQHDGCDEWFDDHPFRIGIHSGEPYRPQQITDVRNV